MMELIIGIILFAVGFFMAWYLRGKSLLGEMAVLELRVRKEWEEKSLAEIDKNQKIQKEAFENLAQRILDKNTEKLEKRSLENLGQVINPFKDRLENLQARINTVYDHEAKQRAELKGEIQKIIEANQKVSLEAHNLAKALKGDVKAQGNWGEMMLERVLESSGLRKGEEYTTQEFQKQEGKRQYLDVLINLPDSKHLIIDSKVSLVAYEKFTSCDDPVEKEGYLKEMIGAIKDHVKGLSGKKYHMGDAVESPEFVLLFFYLESAYSLALEKEPGLFEEAWEKGIIIVSPTTLLATLKTVANIWRFERQSKNAQKIALEAGKLYDKFVGFTHDLDKVGRSIEGASESLIDARKKLSTGNGNVVRKVEELKTLGAKVSKELGEEWLLEDSIR